MQRNRCPNTMNCRSKGKSVAHLAFRLSLRSMCCISSSLGNAADALCSRPSVTCATLDKTAIQCTAVAGCPLPLQAAARRSLPTARRGRLPPHKVRLHAMCEHVQTARGTILRSTCCVLVCCNAACSGRIGMQVAQHIGTQVTTERLCHVVAVASFSQSARQQQQGKLEPPTTRTTGPAPPHPMTVSSQIAAGRRRTPSHFPFRIVPTVPHCSPAGAWPVEWPNGMWPAALQAEGEGWARMATVVGVASGPDEGAPSLEAARSVQVWSWR